MLRLLFGKQSRILRDVNFQLLLLAAVLPALGTALVSPVLGSLIDPLGTSTARVGLVVSVFTAPSVLAIPIAGPLSDRYGRKPLIIWGLVLYGGAGTAIALATEFGLVLLLRFLQGVGFGATFPIITTSIGDAYSGPREAAAQGLRLTASGLSGSVFPAVAGVLVVAAWQYPFLLYAIALPVAVAFAIWFEEPTGRLSRPDSDATGTGGASESDPPYKQALFTAIRHPRVLLIVSGRGFPIIVWTAFLTYSSLIVRGLLGGGPEVAGFLVAFGGFAFAVTGGQSGRVTAALGGRFRVLLLSNALLTGGFAGVLFAPTLGVGFVCTGLSGVGFALSLSLYRSLITGLVGEELRGGLVGISAAVERLSATLTPVAIGAGLGVLTPAVGETVAVQLAGTTAAVFGGGGSVVALTLAAQFDPLPSERGETDP